MRIMVNHRATIARRLADSHVARYHGPENEIGEMLAQLAFDVQRKSRARIVHGQQHAGNLKSRIELTLDQRELNPRLQIAGMLLTMHDARTRLALDVERELREHFPDLVFRTVIPRNVRISEAPSYGRSVIHHDPHCSGSDAYFELAKEVAERG